MAPVLRTTKGYTLFLLIKQGVGGDYPTFIPGKFLRKDHYYFAITFVNGLSRSAFAQPK
jgi:hypothetical protein